MAPPSLALVSPEVGRLVHLGGLEEAVQAGDEPVVSPAPVDSQRGLLAHEDADGVRRDARPPQVLDRGVGGRRRREDAEKMVGGVTEQPAARTRRGGVGRAGGVLVGHEGRG